MAMLFIFIPIIFGAIAGYMAIHGIENWGWFLFAALASLPTIKTKSEKKGKKTEIED